MINTLFWNGHGRGYGYGHGHGHGHGHFSFVSVCFEVLGYFGYFETPKQVVLILKQNNRNKHLFFGSAETSFGSSFVYLKTKLCSFMGHPSSFSSEVLSRTLPLS
jgi:hypothetical protein